VPKTIAAQEESKETGEKDIFELGLLMDTTASMGPWIERAKDKLEEIIDNVLLNNSNAEVRVSFVGYRDHLDDERFQLLGFTTDIKKVRQFI
jgi:hypothetical protein